jgi:dihydroorotate dehydrogenase (fumarate)
MADLRTQWLGFDLQSPVVLASSPMSLDADVIARAVDAGAGAIVLPSGFEVPYTGAPKLATSADGPSGFFLDERGPYLKQLERLRKRFSVPIVGSLNAVSPLIWAGIAKDLESAGASAVDLNLYEVGSAVERSAQDIEQNQLEAARTVFEAV